MSRSILATLALASIALPEGLEPGAFEVTLSTAGSIDVVQESTAPTVTFANVAPGVYTVSACRLAASGERISTPVSAQITVPAQPQVDVPASITLTLG